MALAVLLRAISGLPWVSAPHFHGAVAHLHGAGGIAHSHGERGHHHGDGTYHRHVRGAEAAIPPPAAANEFPIRIAVRTRPEVPPTTRETAPQVPEAPPAMPGPDAPGRDDGYYCAASASALGLASPVAPAILWAEASVRPDNSAVVRRVWRGPIPPRGPPPHPASATL